MQGYVMPHYLPLCLIKPDFSGLTKSAPSLFSATRKCKFLATSTCIFFINILFRYEERDREEYIQPQKKDHGEAQIGEIRHNQT